MLLVSAAQIAESVFLWPELVHGIPAEICTDFYYNKDVPMERERDFYARLARKGIIRRDFMKYCSLLTATLGLSTSFVLRVAEVFAAPKQRPPVIWLHFGECTGCSEATLSTQYPYPDDLILEIISVEYHETIMAAAGRQAEDQLQSAVEKHNGKFICVVEGAIATNYNGGYGKIGGRPLY